MLDDSQIERYARQILLPRVGASGQERLLASSVEIRGSLEDTRGCAAWLAGAGVGRIALPDGEHRHDPLVARNPDCQWLDRSLHAPTLHIGVGCLPGSPSSGTALLWAGGRDGALGWAILGAEEGCPDCRRALPPWGPVDPTQRTLLGAILATAALRSLLGIAPADAADAFLFEPSRGMLQRIAFPFRRGCVACEGQA